MTNHVHSVGQGLGGQCGLGGDLPSSTFLCSVTNADFAVQRWCDVMGLVPNTDSDVMGTPELASRCTVNRLNKGGYT